jgi:hypothetical protein
MVAGAIPPVAGAIERRAPVSAVRRHSLITFWVLTYAISWGFLPIEAVGFIAGGPFIAALIVTPLTEGLSGLRELGSRLIRWRVGWFLL